MKDTYQQSWSQDADHLKTLKNIKEGKYTISPYLNIIKNPKIRKIYTNLRISNSKLAFSTTNRDKQNCTICNTIETVEHFLCICPKFNSIRNQFNIFEHKEHLSNHTKFAFVLDPIDRDDTMIKKLCKFLDSMYALV